MVVEELAESLDAGDHTRDCIATTERLLIKVDSCLPGGAGEFAEQTAVVATVTEYKSP